MITARRLLLPFIALISAPVLAQRVTNAPLGEAVERHLPDDEPMQWVHDPEYVETEQGDTLATREVAAEQLETVKLTGLVPPIRFESGVADIPESTVAQLEQILDSMQDRRNVRLHLVGHADNQPLSAELAAVFGDNEGLSRERAGEVAEFLQARLALPPDAVSYEWAGDTDPVASNETAEGRAANRRVEVEVWYDEVTAGVEIEEFLVEQQIKRIKVCRMDTVCKLRYRDGHAHRARVQNLIAPLHYDADGLDVPDDFVEQVRQALENLADKRNVVVKFVGYTDDRPLTGRFERIYGTHVGLSAARARRVALAVQDALELPTAAVDSDGRGAESPLGSNETARGRQLNRRVEVELWYDDPLQELPDEPRLCPADAGSTLVTRVYDPPWGRLDTVAFENGDPAIPAGLIADLERALADVAERRNPRLRFVGYTRNERLSRRTALVYGDDIGLSAARARRTMEAVAERMGLAADEIEFEGRGYLHSDDVVNAGFIQGETSHVVVQVLYDESALADDYDGVDITPLTREIRPENPFALNMMRITVDGEPIDDPGRSSADIQRCIDVALDDADIRFGFDTLTASPRLSVSAAPTTVALVESADGLAPESSVQFRMYANYTHFIERTEVRIFEAGQSLRAKPVAVVDMNADGRAEWRPQTQSLEKPLRELEYVLRAYGRDGAFDETAAKPLWLVRGRDGDDEPGDRPSGSEAAGDSSGGDGAGGATRLLAGYGENDLAVRNIGLSSGTVKVQGTDIPPGHTVWVAGQPVPVDDDGAFVAETILPTGMHTVEVAVLDPQGNGELFLRDLELEPNDWFYVGMADMTLSSTDSNGPIDALHGENAQLDHDASSYGRLAFYVNGKFGEHWELAASADTREAPFDALFSNFLDKSPESLFRRIDPDYHYPTFGDDGVVRENAPTSGRFFVRLDRGENYGQWGSFKVGYMNNELAQVDRGLYGGTIHYESPGTTSFGEQRFAIDAFTAEPGTVPSREEFRGTGGSLYYLRRQDILTGSERVRVEIRDKASGLVTGVVNLRPVLDYDIDYLQGRILLNRPLESTASESLLVRSDALDGDEVYLVVRYEHTPGFDEADALAVGGQVHYWVNEHVKLGLTTNANEQGEIDSELGATDVTFRKSAQTWLKLQVGQTEGFLTSSMRSDDGGFDFYGYDGTSFVTADAGAERADLSFGLSDFFGRQEGRLNLYGQELEAGYAAPGLATPTDTRNYGGRFTMQVTGDVSLTAKADRRIREQGIETHAAELDVGWRLNESWGVSAGVREDLRRDGSPTVPLTQEQGERRDAVVQVNYDSLQRWRTYGFVQETMSVSGDRRENGRVGIGGEYRISERLGIDVELSDGDLGRGGKLGTRYMPSERTSLYLNYALDNETERSEYGLGSSRGRQGNLVAGAKTRFSDSTSVFLEERYRHDQAATGLTHSTGVSFAPADRLSFSASTDIGTLRDVRTGAETNRTAGGVRVGYGRDAVTFSSGIEYRLDEIEQGDLSTTERTTWLFRNDFKYQMTPAARLLGKLNYSDSESSAGQFYDGGYTEAVVGFGFRPVRNDRLNALAKYTYFYNLPTADQITLSGTAAEFVQRSHVASVDVTYDIRPRWSIGGKYARRVGEVSLDRENPEFFDNGAELYILRADWGFAESWEALLEGRLLDMSDIGERKSGGLVVVSRSIGRHVKLGLGYNFTDFSDDLTDLSFDHRGTFLTLTGAM